MFSQLFNLNNYLFNPYAVPIIVVGVCIFSISFFVLRQNRSSPVNIAFFIQCLAFSLWLFTMPLIYLSRVPAIALFWYRYFTFFSVVMIMPGVILFALAWSGELPRKIKFVITNYALSLVFYLLAITTDKMISPTEIRTYFWGYYPVYKVGMFLYLVFFFWQYLVGFYTISQAYRSEKVLLTRMQRKLVAIASLIAVTASVDYLPKFFNISLYPFGYIPMFIYISIIAYSIVRYRAFDIETVIHKTAMWMVTSSLIIIPEYFLYRWFLPYMHQSGMVQMMFWIISFLTVAYYLRNIQPRIDHFFQRRRSNLETILTRFTEELVHLKSLEQLIQSIEHTISAALYPQQVEIFLHNETQNTCKLANLSGNGRVSEIKCDKRLFFWLVKTNKVVYREFVDIDPAYAAVKEELKKYFGLTDSIVVVPVVLNEKLLAVVNLGKKADLKPYGAIDFQFLNALKNQSTIAISNSLLYENIEEQVRQRTKELVEVQKQLVQAEKLATVGTLAGGVAHEINNPLTAILTNAQMLLDSDSIVNQEDKESLKLIEDATKRCRTIVRKLMTYAKKPVEAGEMREINLLDVVNNTVRFLNYQLLQENVRILTRIVNDECRIRGNANELEQVLTNMILNGRDAIKQVKPSGDIYISLAKEGDWVTLEIQDEGVGIPKEILAKIYDPFFTTKDVGKGLGLGLSICQSIVERHKGKISVQSEASKGTMFSIRFPACAMARMDQAMPAAGAGAKS